MSAFRKTWQALRVPSHHFGRISTKFRFEQPTGVQRAALDALMPRSPSMEATRGPPAQHAIIRWPTGSGKTLAFALPLAARLDMSACGHGLQALVVAPTRELALQTLHVLKRLTAHGTANRKGHRVKVMALLGRSTPRRTMELKRHPPDIAVATPIAIAAALERRELRLSQEPKQRTLVLDEIGALTGSGRHWEALRRVLYAFEGSGQPANAGQAAGKGVRGGRGARPRWAQGSMWFVSAHVPPGAVDAGAGSVPQRLREERRRGGRVWAVGEAAAR